MSLRHWLHDRVSPGFANLAAVVGALGARIVIETLPKPGDLNAHNPPGHALPAKASATRPGLPPVTPRAIIRDGATRAGGGTHRATRDPQTPLE